MTPNFIAIDGEADNQGRYIVLCDSQGRVLYNPEGISTSEALTFILSLPSKHEVVCYGLNYDVNQWIKDLPRPALEGLAANNRCNWQSTYKLEWIPSKMFGVTIPGKTVTVAEVFGFFQTSFVKALQSWGMDAPEEIERMKAKRGTFSHAEIERVIRYCQRECLLLVQLMGKLYDACKQADCVPRGRWIGAGSIASSLMTRHRVKDHHCYDEGLFGQDITDNYVLRAYYGGRVELYRQGWSQDVTAVDINSAYPYAATFLPSLADAKYVVVNRFTPELPGLWRVSWHMRSEQTIGPFPVRLPSGQICYPLQGEGVYHTPEVLAALDCNYPIAIHEGIVLTNAPVGWCRWIGNVYNERARMKREGSFGEKALKLGMNSVYGKFAQGYGYGRKPPFQSYYWAGLITSLTRAIILRKLNVAQYPIMVATDGIVKPTEYEPVRHKLRGGFGGYDVKRYDKVATIQPGVYLAESESERIVKSRGFFARDVDYDQLLHDFYRDSLGCYHYDSRRFIGLKVALHRKDFSLWRQWVTERRSIAFEVNNKGREEHFDGSVTLYPPSGPYSSLAYTPKQSLYDDPTDDDLDNLVRDDQPHREVD